MIDRSYIGHELPATELCIDRARLRFFAEAIGETDPVYTSEHAARAAGHPDIPAPPTFLFAIDMDSRHSFRWLASMGVPLERVLHAEQSFTYEQMAYAGDVITASTRVEDIYVKKGGALEFVALVTTAWNQRRERVGAARCLLVVRRG